MAKDGWSAVELVLEQGPRRLIDQDTNKEEHASRTQQSATRESQSVLPSFPSFLQSIFSLHVCSGATEVDRDQRWRQGPFLRRNRLSSPARYHLASQQLGWCGKRCLSINMRIGAVGCFDPLSDFAISIGSESVAHRISYGPHAHAHLEEDRCRPARGDTPEMTLADADA